MIVKLLTEHHLEFLSLKGCRGLSESTHDKMPHCWKSHAVAHFIFIYSLSNAKKHLPFVLWIYNFQIMEVFVSLLCDIMKFL